MKNLIKYLVVLGCITMLPEQGMSQLNCTGDGGYATDGDETPCGVDVNKPCCTIWDACNGPYSGCNNYDPDYPSGCDLSCTPIDSGVLFLLLGGAAFGGSMIARNRRRELLLESERV